MAHGTAPTETDGERRSALAARRARVLAAVAVVGAVLAATGASALMLAAPGERRTPRESPGERTAAEPAIRLDGLRRPTGRSRDHEVVGRRGRLAPVIGVGANRFLARRGGASPVLDVDGRIGGPANEVASDGEVRRQLEALERENARIEAALRGLGGSGVGTGELIWPVRGPITSPFGNRWGRLHAGIDIGVPTGTAVHAADSGRVVISGVVGGYGNYICIQHTRTLTTCYGHNSRLGVGKGDRVRKGGVIARSGCTGSCTGPHVHFETRVNGTPVNPLRFL